MLKIVSLLALLATAAFAVPVVELQDEATFAEDALKAHNLHRAAHGVAPLKLNSDLTAMAKLRASQLGLSEAPSAQVNLYKDEFVGESVAVVGKFFTGKDITDLWHASMSKYPEELKHNKFEKSRSFAQIVWNNTQEVGFAYIKSIRNGKYFIVAEYFPSGNVEGQYERNVDLGHLDMARDEETTSKKMIVIIVADGEAKTTTPMIEIEETTTTFEPIISTTTTMEPVEFAPTTVESFTSFTTTTMEPEVVTEVIMKKPIMKTTTTEEIITEAEMTTEEMTTEEMTTLPAMTTEEEFLTTAAPKVVSVIKTIVKTVNTTHVIPATTLKPTTTPLFTEETIIEEDKPVIGGRIVKPIVTEPIMTTDEITTTTEEMITTTNSNTMHKGKLTMKDLLAQEAKDDTVIIVAKKPIMIQEDKSMPDKLNLTVPIMTADVHSFNNVMAKTTEITPIMTSTEEIITTMESTTPLIEEVTTVEETTTTIEPITTTEMLTTTIEETTTFLPTTIEVEVTTMQPKFVEMTTMEEEETTIEEVTTMESTTLSKNKPLPITPIPIKPEHQALVSEQIMESITTTTTVSPPVIFKTGTNSLRDYLEAQEKKESAKAKHI